MSPTYRTRRFVAFIIILLAIAFPIAQTDLATPTIPLDEQSQTTRKVSKQLASLEVKGRAPKTGYGREQFGSGWGTSLGCDVRNIILKRDLKQEEVDEECHVLSGVLRDPYTAQQIQFTRGSTTSSDVQIDHVVALSNAWQTGAQQLSGMRRTALANDPLNLLAVSGDANQQKSDGDAATWLPPHKAFRCQYVSRQVGVKVKYHLWVTPAEKEAIERILRSCP